MTDIALNLFGPDDTLVPVFDVSLSGTGDLQSDDGLEAAVILSLFLDKRALNSDDLPDASDDRRGWWADVFSDSNDQIGSRLWLINRTTLTQQTLVKARAYIEEALAWLVDDGVASRVAADVTRLASGRMGISIIIDRADGTRWQRLWQLGSS